jgi:ABC-type transport system substrate-binding protein
MANPAQSVSLKTVRILGGLLAVGVLLLLAGWVVGEPPRTGEVAKDAGKVKDKRDEEKEDDKGPTKKKPPPDDPENIRPGPSTAPEGDLADALRQATKPSLKRLYKELLVPRDSVTIRGRRLTIAVPLLPLVMADEKARPRLREKRTLNLVGDDGQPGAEVTLTPDIVQSVKAFEELGEKAVQDFLQEREPIDAEEQLIAAERALAWVLRTHESARAQRLREGAGWKAVEDRLRKRLIDVLIARVKQLGGSHKWDATFALVNRLATTYLRDDPSPLAEPLVELLDKATADGTASKQDIREAYRQLHRMEERFRDNPKVKVVADKLDKRAKELADKGQKLIEQGKRAEGLALIEQALEIRPHLTEAEDSLRKTLQTYPILRVGVRHLPEYFSPAWASTDSERRALELIFEGLVRYSPDERGGGRYHAGLAVGRPRVVPGGRRFHLPANAFWSNGEPLTVYDIRATVRRLKEGARGTGLSPAWGELLNDFRENETVGRGDPGRIDLTLNQGCLEPLALMTFKVLPRSFVHRKRDADDHYVATKEFALDPICSGPFVPGKRGRIGDRDYVPFVANVNFGKRDGARGRVPRIREVHFVQYSSIEDAAGLDLLLDLTANEAAKLRDKGDDEWRVPTPEKLPPNRRVYFLLPGPKGPLDSADLRRALAYAINREALLDAYFRGKEKRRDLHKALNGPYPAGCWACDPTLKPKLNKTNDQSLDPFDAPAAKAALAEYTRKGGVVRELLLSYPDGDAAVKEAMEALCQQVNTVLGAALLKAEPVSPHSLRTRVAAGRFDLAYWHYDFPDETYWLGPLLGPKGLTGGRGETVVKLLGQAAGRRDFAKLSELAHLIHRTVLKEEMPLVPLWQLDPLLAIHRGVKAPPFDPRLVFTDIERWSVAR